MTAPSCAAAPELLAPAGDWPALRAAVAAGADAVYFGLGTFNARRRARNFTVESLPEVLGFLHERRVRGYVTLNTLIFPDELGAAVAQVRALAAAGADAVIVQDVGLIPLIRRLAPSLPIHASTQMTQTEPEGLALLAAWGVGRAILARELTLPELAAIVRAAPLPVEVFVHGALCISYSGQCLASEALWGRSGNRGLCGQACRLPWTLVVDNRPVGPAARAYPLSPRDLATLDRLPELVALGVAALKIEGRLKDAAYVAAVTRAYRAALDRACAGGAPTLPPEVARDLAHTFSRGTGPGFLAGVDHGRLVEGRTPGRRGLLLGQVTTVTPRGVVLVLATPAASTADLPIKPGDGVVFEQVPTDADAPGGRVYAVRPATATEATRPAGRGAPSKGTVRSRPHADAAVHRVELEFGREDIELARVAPGARVWKTDDPAVRRRLERFGAESGFTRRIPVHAEVTVCPAAAPVGSWNLTLTLRSDDVLAVRVAAPEPLAPARTQPLTRAALRTQLDRLGDTPFALAGVALLAEGQPAESVPVMLPRSVLNELRRAAAAELRGRLAERHRHAVADIDAVAVERAALRAVPAPADAHAPRLHVLVRTPAQLAAARAWQADRPETAGDAYVDFGRPADWTALHAAAPGVGLATPRIVHPGEWDRIARALPRARGPVLVRTLGALRRLREHTPDRRLVGDASLNAANEIGAGVLRAAGLARVTPAADLTFRQLRLLLDAAPPTACEVVVHQHLPLLHTRHCLLAGAAADAAGEDPTDAAPACCRSPSPIPCAARAATRYGRPPCDGPPVRLRDRNGVDHVVWVDALGRSTVFHGAAQSAAEYVPQLLALGVRDFRIELLEEPPDAATRLLDAYAALLTGTRPPADVLDAVRAATPAGVTRGTWAREEPAQPDELRAPRAMRERGTSAGPRRM